MNRANVSSSATDVASVITDSSTLGAVARTSDETPPLELDSILEARITALEREAQEAGNPLEIRETLTEAWRRFWQIRNSEVTTHQDELIRVGDLTHGMRRAEIEDIERIFSSGIISGEIRGPRLSTIVEDAETHGSADFFVNLGQTRSVNDYITFAWSTVESESGLLAKRMEHSFAPSPYRADNKVMFVLDGNNSALQPLLAHSATGDGFSSAIMARLINYMPAEGRDHLAVLGGVPSNFINKVIIGRKFSEEEAQRIYRLARENGLNIKVYYQDGVLVVDKHMASSSSQIVPPRNTTAIQASRRVSSTEPEPSAPRMATATEPAMASEVSDEKILRRLLAHKSFNESEHKDLVRNLIQARREYSSAKREYEQAIADLIQRRMASNPNTSRAAIIDEIIRTSDDPSGPLHMLKLSLLSGEFLYTRALSSLRAEAPRLHAAYRNVAYPSGGSDPVAIQIQRMIAVRNVRPKQSQEDIAMMRRLLPGFDENSAREFYAIFQRTEQAWNNDKSFLAAEAKLVHKQIRQVDEEVKLLDARVKRLTRDNPGSTELDEAQRALNAKNIELQILQVQYALRQREITRAVSDKFKLIEADLRAFLDARNMRSRIFHNSETSALGFYLWKNLSLNISSEAMLSADVNQFLAVILFHELVHHHQFMSSMRVSIQEVLQPLLGGIRTFGEIDPKLAMQYSKEIIANFKSRRKGTPTASNIDDVLHWSRSENLLEPEFISFVKEMDRDFKTNTGNWSRSVHYKESAAIIAGKIVSIEPTPNNINSAAVRSLLQSLMEGTSVEHLARHGKLAKNSHGAKLAERIFGSRKLPDVVTNLILGRGEAGINSQELALLDILKARLEVRKRQRIHYLNRYYRERKEEFAFGLQTGIEDLIRAAMQGIN